MKCDGMRSMTWCHCASDYIQCVPCFRCVFDSSNIWYNRICFCLVVLTWFGFGSAHRFLFSPAYCSTHTPKPSSWRIVPSEHDRINMSIVRCMKLFVLVVAVVVVVRVLLITLVIHQFQWVAVSDTQHATKETSSAATTILKRWEEK